VRRCYSASGRPTAGGRAFRASSRRGRDEADVSLVADGS
jgi:hypothetical protein